jgi:hypothetical protein
VPSITPTATPARQGNKRGGFRVSVRTALSKLRPVVTAESGPGHVPSALGCLGCFSSILPQNRHPERSASQIDRVTQRLGRGVEGPRRHLIYPCCSELFNHRARSGFSLGPRKPRTCYVPVTIKCVSQQILLSRFGGRKAPSSMGKLSAAEVLRLRAPSAVSRDQSVRRSAQDDDSVGVLTKNILNKLALTGCNPGVL